MTVGFLLDDAFQLSTGIAGGLAYAAGGLMLTRRVPRNVLGRLRLTNAVVFGSFALSSGYPAYAYAHPGTLPGAHVVAVLDAAAWPLVFAPLVALVLVFPDGRLEVRRPRAFGAGAVASYSAVTVIGSVRRRFRGADPTLRAQLKWLVYVSGLIPLTVIAGVGECRGPCSPPTCR